MRRTWMAFLTVAVFLSFSTMAHAETEVHLKLTPGNYTISTQPVNLKTGPMQLYLKNSGKDLVHYYVIEYCAPATDVCPVLAEGTVKPGKAVARVQKVPAAKYIFKVDCPSGKCRASGYFKQ
ncbi:hypothetical protein [Polycladomyces subterraneus]|uniref:Phosphatidylglycerol/phosphatidylinositol transfer protein n=1 Tax=Polycladomyces subterraneus TaxID=1016997 RepID=A0ABT8IRL6_9BACL|nr:hypothetical protein [Polycladomyces subterraneus]MDN4595007.1 hypothetical protein [Polycladomyces subterraneus]